jgi:hypothetical protein
VGFSRFGEVVIANILAVLLAAVGAILLIIPGIVWFLKYSLATYAVMDLKLSGIAAFHFSGVITKGNKVRLLGIWMLMFICIIPATPFIFGLFSFFMGDANMLLLLCGFPFYLLNVLVLMPWFSAVLAKAYYDLSRHEIENRSGLLEPKVPSGA